MFVKFVIWGYGQRGKIMIDLLGKHRIAAIIDSSMLPGKIDDIPVLSKEELEKNYKMYPIIVTPKGFEKEICNDLKKMGCMNTITWSDQYYEMSAFLLWNNKKDYLYDKSIVIGFSGLGLLVYEYLVNEGKNAVLFSSNKINIDMVTSSTDIRMINKSSECVVVEDKEYKLLRDKDRYFNIINLGKKFTLFQNNKKIEKLKDVERNKRIFIVATGPSLKVDDLNTLEKNNEICIGVNGIVNAFNMTDWRPKYYVLSDREATKRYAHSILGTGIQGFLSDNSAELINLYDDGFLVYHIENSPREGDEYGISTDFSYGAFAGYTVTYVAIQLAIYLGASEIYLLGVDCNYLSDPKNNYFIKDNIPVDIIDHEVGEMIYAYKSARSFADCKKIKIYNATRGGKLEVFERVEFDTLFS